MSQIDIRKEIIIASATGVYAGYIPVAPGTFGTVAAVPLVLAVSLLGPVMGSVVLVAFAGFSVWVAGEAEVLFGKKDSGQIVIDEMAGFLVTLFLIPCTVQNLVLGFILFRVADITKPYPIRKLEVCLPGGWGVVADDLLAGVYAHAGLRLILLFLL